MDARLTYNKDAIIYDKHRPTYSMDIYEDIFNYSGLNDTKRALEIGIGTGKASKPILESGCFLSAIELGEKLAAYTENKYKEYKKFKMYNTSFEDYSYIPENFDLIYSATAFHWIPEDIGYNKVYKMLKSGGTLSLFWNRPTLGDGELSKQIKSLYNKYAPEIDLNKYMADQNTYDGIKNALKKYGFIDIKFKLINRTRTFTPEDYISLLNTYSYHISIADNIKIPLQDEIISVINKYGGKITVYDTIDLYLAKKP